jgi:hypothetical protein
MTVVTVVHFSFPVTTWIDVREKTDIFFVVVSVVVDQVN